MAPLLLESQNMFIIRRKENSENVLDVIFDGNKILCIQTANFCDNDHDPYANKFNSIIKELRTQLYIIFCEFSSNKQSIVPTFKGRRVLRVFNGSIILNDKSRHMTSPMSIHGSRSIAEK